MMRKLDFAEGFTAKDLLQRLQDNVPYLLAPGTRGPEFRPGWKKMSRYAVGAESEDISVNRAEFEAYYGADPLMRAIRFQGPWGPNLLTVCAGVARWAQGALQTILVLEQEIDGHTATVLARDQEIAALKARVEQVQRNAADQEQSMEDLIQDLRQEKANLKAQIGVLSNNLEEARRQTIAATERAQSWEAMARTATESATAASNAVAMLREVFQASQAKARFHDGGIVPNDGTMIVVRDR